MPHFTKAQINEIARQIATVSVKDTDFESASRLSSDDYVAIVQDGVNKKIRTSELADAVLDTLVVDSTPVEESENPVTSGGVYEALSNLVVEGGDVVAFSGEIEFDDSNIPEIGE